MKTWSMFEFLLSIYSSLQSLSADLISFFANDVTLGSSSFSYFELLFGAGFVAFMGYVVVKFILDIVL